MGPTPLIILYILVQVLFGLTTSDLTLKTGKNDNISDEMVLKILAGLPESTVNLTDLLFGPTTSDLTLKTGKNANISDEMVLKVLAGLRKSTVNLTDIEPHQDDLRDLIAKYKRDAYVLKERRLSDRQFASSAPSAAMHRTILTSFLTAMTFLCI